MIGVRAIWRRRLGVLSVTFLGRSPLHVAVPLATFHLPLRAAEGDEMSRTSARGRRIFGA